MKVKKILSTVLIYVIIVFLGAVLALNYVLFITPNHFSPAGLNGIAVMIQYKCNFSVGYMSLLVNVPLCVFAYFCIDKKFAVKTLVFCLVYSAAYLFFENLPGIEQFQYAAKDEQSDTLYPIVIGALITGVCFGILFRLNGSTGGTDIVSKYVSKVKPELNFFWILFAINAVIAAVSYFVYGVKDPVTGQMVYKYEPVCMCLVYCFLSSFVGNKIIVGFKQAYKITVVTNHAAELEKELIEKLHHSATRMHGIGSFSQNEKDVLLCLVNKRQLVDFENIIKKYPDTFSYVEMVDQTFGKFRRKVSKNTTNENDNID